MNDKAITKAFYARMATSDLPGALTTYEESIDHLKRRMDEEDDRCTPQEYRDAIAWCRERLDIAQAELDSRQ